MLPGPTFFCSACERRSCPPNAPVQARWANAQRTGPAPPNPPAVACNRWLGGRFIRPLSLWCSSWACQASSLQVDSSKIPPGAPSCQVFQKQIRRRNTAARRRLGGPTFTHLGRGTRSSPTLTAFKPRGTNLRESTGDPGADTTVANRGLHSRHLTPGVSGRRRATAPLTWVSPSKARRLSAARRS